MHAVLGSSKFSMKRNSQKGFTLMFKRIFGKSKKTDTKADNDDLNKEADYYDASTIYEDYKALMESKLVSWGFNISKDEGSISGVTKYKNNELEVILSYDMRDPGVYLTARSGKKIPAKSRIDEMEKLIGKKPTNYDEIANQLIDKADISMALSGSNEEKSKLIQDIENWYHENS